MGITRELRHSFLDLYHIHYDYLIALCCVLGITTLQNGYYQRAVAVRQRSEGRKQITESMAICARLGAPHFFITFTKQTLHGQR